MKGGKQRGHTRPIFGFSRVATVWKTQKETDLIVLIFVRWTYQDLMRLLIIGCESKMICNYLAVDFILVAGGLIDSWNHYLKRKSKKSKHSIVNAALCTGHTQNSINIKYKNIKYKRKYMQVQPLSCLSSAAESYKSSIFFHSSREVNETVQTADATWLKGDKFLQQSSDERLIKMTHNVSNGSFVAHQ